jgi:hypothetical protein
MRIIFTYRVLIITGLSLVSLLLVILCRENIGYSKSDTGRGLNDITGDKYAVFPVSLPDELEFAGEKVPMNRFDIRESLDREMLVNIYFQSQTLLYLKRAGRFFPVIESILRKNEIPEDFKYLAVAESGLTNVVSPANAVGFWQFLEGTADEYGLEVNKEVDERYHLEKSTEAACKYIRESFDKYGSWTLAAASYNAGRNLVDTQISRQMQEDYYHLLLGDETGRYIFRILSYKLILSNPSGYGYYLGDEDLYREIPCFEVTLNGPVQNFAEFAAEYGISYKILKFFNPWLRESYLSNKNGKTYYIRIPRDNIYRDAASLPGKTDSAGFGEERLISPDPL